MSDDLLAGVLTRGKQTLIVVVDKRVGKPYWAVGERNVEVRFCDLVAHIEVLEGRARRMERGNVLSLHLPGRGGQLLAVSVTNGRTQ